MTRTDFDFGLDHPVPGGYTVRTINLALLAWGGLEYLHRNPASRKRQRKWNPAPGGITGPHCSWGYKYGNLALQVGGISDETVKYGYGFWATRTIEWLHCKLQTRPLVRERDPTDTKPQMLDSNIPTGNNIWSQVPQGYSIPRHINWLTVIRKVTSTSISTRVAQWLRLAVPKWLNRLCNAFPSSEDRNAFIFRNATSLAYLTMDTGQKLSGSDDSVYHRTTGFLETVCVLCVYYISELKLLIKKKVNMNSLKLAEWAL
jgi:hypothetical protein